MMPIGAIEQHSPHLPMSTNLISASWVSQLVAEKLEKKGIPAVIAPAFIIANSIVLAYDESLVDPSYKELSGYAGGCIEYEDERGVSTFHYMESHTKNGIMGNAYAATKEKGLKLVDAYSDSICEMLGDERLWALPV